MELLALSCVVGVGGLISLLSVGLLVWSFWRPRRWAEQWVRSAAALGLELEPFEGWHRVNLFDGSPPSIKQRMRGRRGGLDVEAGVRVVVSGSGKNRSVSYFTYARARFGRSLGMGLQLSPLHWLARAVLGGGGSGDVRLGDEMIDRAFAIRGIDEAHVRALLTRPYVAGALRVVAHGAFRPFVTDEELRFERSGRVLDAPTLSAAIDQAVDLALRILAAHEEVGPSDTARAIDAAMRELATRRGLHARLERGWIGGRVEGMHVEVEAQIRGHHRWTRFTTRFDRPLGIRLRLGRPGAFSGVGKLLGMQDIEVGEPVFDARFVVQGQPEGAVRAVLTAEVCARLTALQEQSHTLQVQDDRIEAEVAYPITDAEALERGLLAMARVGAAMCGVTPNRAGPFRG